MYVLSAVHTENKLKTLNTRKIQQTVTQLLLCERCYRNKGERNGETDVSKATSPPHTATTIKRTRPKNIYENGEQHKKKIKSEVELKQNSIFFRIRLHTTMTTKREHLASNKHI